MGRRAVWYPACGPQASQGATRIPNLRISTSCSIAASRRYPHAGRGRWCGELSRIPHPSPARNNTPGLPRGLARGAVSPFATTSCSRSRTSPGAPAVRFPSGKTAYARYGRTRRHPCFSRTSPISADGRAAAGAGLFTNSPALRRRQNSPAWGSTDRAGVPLLPAWPGSFARGAVHQLSFWQNRSASRPAETAPPIFSPSTRCHVNATPSKPVLRHVCLSCGHIRRFLRNHPALRFIQVAAIRSTSRREARAPR